VIRPLISVDARTFGPTGLGAYVSDLLENFVSTGHEFRFRVLCREPETMPRCCAGKFEFVRATSPIYGLNEQWEIARLARGTDLLHCPHYNIPYFYRGPLVVTIHDLTHLVYPEFLPSRLAYLYASSMLRAAAHRARQIITISQFSKQAICDRLEVNEEKVHVIPRVLSRSFFEMQGRDHGRLLRKLGVRTPYFLFVGLLKPHKNVQGLLRAFALIPETFRDSLQLVIAGKLDSFYPALRRITEELSLQGQVLFTGHVSEEELHSLYACAMAFVLPSLNEGFGLPVLEAMAYGVPVIVSKTSSLPEVTGDAGILVDPTDPASIAGGMVRVLSDEALRQQLSERGRERTRLFSAKEFAQRHLEVYRRALEG